MKCLIIDGCPKKSNTWSIVKIVKEQMQNCGEVEFVEIELKKLDLPFCAGCSACFIKGEDKCPHASVIQPIAKKFEEADCVIITSSTYSLGLTALCKNFIDHMSYNFHRPRFFTKKALIISTTAGAGADTVVKYIRDIFKHWGFNKVHTLGLTVYSSSGYVPKGRVLEKSNKIATEFYNDVKNKKLYSPTLKRLMYFNAWRAINEKGSQADCQYWIDTKFNENSFSPDVKIGFLKKSIGNILFKIIKKNMPK